ncbi:MAG TPA: DUF3300 domain-containing protein [Bryobacteraceae bacterium]|nr:DUF3300 domain-containing protein [Bryobacteraceae bacterium]
MNDPRFGRPPSRAVSIVCTLLLVLFPAGALLTAQAPPPQPLSPEQLDTLVAPVALYPDSLLSQVFVAATYPLELVEANQWLQQNRNLQGTALVNAAQQQNWDASVQALVVFPDVLTLLTSNIRWTTDLGNAFLAQQADVMNAVQRMRAQAQADGKLSSNGQQTVTNQTEDGRPVIEIAPANPQVVYVPAYDPAYIWGPPAWGYYPPLYYPAYGFGYDPGIYIGAFFGGIGWGGWGWGPNWFNCTIVQNGFFFNRFGFGRFHEGFRGGVWAHDPGHRLGVPYPSAGVASRFAGARFAGGQQGFRAPGGGSAGFGSRGSGPIAGSRADPGGWRRFGEPGTGGRNFQSGVVGGTANRYAAQPVNRGGSWSRFGTPNSQPAYRSGPAFNNAARPSPSFGASRAAPNYNRTPAYGSYRSAPAPSFGGAYRGGVGGGSPAPSFGGSYRGGGGGGGPAPSFGGAYRSGVGGGRPAPSFGGGGFRSGGGGFHAGGGGGVRGGGSHGGGGGGGHRR